MIRDAASVEAEQLTKRFRPPLALSDLARGRARPETTAVDRVSLSLRPGEAFGLVGPNGAGKTTFIKLLCGLLLPSAGSARIAGYDTVRDGFAVRRRIGLVTSNERSFFWRLTGRQNLEFFAELYRMPPADSRIWIDELIARLDLGGFARQRFDACSPGIKQRFALARGLLTRPKILFMDEPTKGVDPTAANDIIQLIRERVVAPGDCTALITSHNLREIERLCGRVAVMSHGRFVAEGTIGDLRALAGGQEIYQLAVRGLEGERLERALALEGLAEPARVARVDGVVRIEVRFEPDRGGLPRFLRAVIEGGGDVESCNRIEPAFEDVFQAIVSRSAAARPGSGSHA